MILDRFVLTNVGPFIERNEIAFHYSDERPICLIGGRNGAGKTTFFKAIRICLYGCRAFGYEANNPYYYVKLRHLINDKVLLQRDGVASVEAYIDLNDGDYKGSYQIIRKWQCGRKTISESVSYVHDGTKLDDLQAMEFENLLLHLVPPAAFDYYFFDGENISSLVRDDGASAAFRSAFIKMCGLDNLEILAECFRQSSNKTDADLKIAAAYHDALNKREKTYAELNDLSRRLSELTAQKEDVEMRLRALRDDYRKSGGCSPQEWVDLQQKLNAEENQRSQWKKELRDFANNGLPFLILKKELAQLLSDLDEQRSHEHMFVARKFFEEHRSVWTPYLKNQRQADALMTDLFPIDPAVSDRLRPIMTSAAVLPDLGLDYQIKGKIDIDPTPYLIMESGIRRSLGRTKRLNGKMMSLSVDNYETFKTREIELLTLLKKITDESHALPDAIAAAEANVKAVEAIYDKCKKAYENDIKKMSIHEISARAYLVLSKFTSTLYRDYVRAFKTSFKTIFAALIGKKKLIDGIEIDDDLSVYPYRYTVMKLSDIEKMLHDKGVDGFKEYVGQAGYAAYKRSRADLIRIPSKITATLSKGEHQIYLMSLYFALVNIGIRSMPFIIDTPFGRIDKQHRDNLLANFFLKLKGQLIILSTDEEINEGNVALIRHRLGSIALLQNSDGGCTRILKDRYFFDIAK